MTWIKQKLNIVYSWIKKELKWILVSTGIIAIVFAAGELPENTPTNLLLKADKESILTSKETDDIRCNDDTNICQNVGKIIKYYYATNTEVSSATYKGLQEDLSLRTNNSQHFHSNGKDTVVYYSGWQFVKKETDNKWYQVEVATTTVEEYERQTEISFFEKLINTTFAGSGDPYSPSLDGYISYVPSGNWSTARNSAVGDTADYTDDNGRAVMAGKCDASTFSVGRGFLLFDTSDLPDDVQITTATLSVYVTSVSDADNDGNDFFNVSTSTPASNTELVIQDFDQIGLTEGSDRVDLTGLGTSAYTNFALNTAGKTWISVDGITKFSLREGHDLLNHEPVGECWSENIVSIDWSEHTGTASDPKLVIEYPSATIPTDENLIIFE